jgi:hypothetical protein
MLSPRPTPSGSHDELLMASNATDEGLVGRSRLAIFRLITSAILLRWPTGIALSRI